MEQNEFELAVQEENVEKLTDMRDQESTEGNLEVAELIQKAIDEIMEKALSASTTPEIQTRQVLEQGGSALEVKTATAPVDEEIFVTKNTAVGELEAMKEPASEEIVADNQTESASKEQLSINNLIQEIEKNNQLSESLAFGYQSEIATKIGKSEISYGDISSLPKEQKKEVMDYLVREQQMSIYMRPELLAELDTDQLRQLNNSRSLMDYADAEIAGGVLNKAMSEYGSWTKLKDASREQVGKWQLPIQKNLYAMKYAEMFSYIDAQGKFNMKALTENLSSVAGGNLSEMMKETKQDLTTRIHEDGLLSLNSTLGKGFVQMAKSKFIQANLFKDNPLFDQIKNSKMGLKEYMADKNTRAVTDLLAIYSKMKKSGVLSEEQFKELTTV